MDHHKEDELRLLAETLPNVSAQLRSSLGNLYTAFSGIATPERRAADPELDLQAALLMQSYSRLLRLANNLTDASRLIETVPLPMQMVDLTTLTQNIYRECLPHAEILGIELQLSCPQTPLLTAANEDSIRRVLYHFLSNAFKFTKSGKSVTLRCRKEGNHLLLSVDDEGCGISDISPDLLFERYLQNDLPAPAPHGLGLGLSLARQTAQAMGGQILLSSRESGGTSATLSLPIRTTGVVMQEPRFDYTGGFPGALVALSDALPPGAFLENPITTD